MHSILKDEKLKQDFVDKGNKQAYVLCRVLPESTVRYHNNKGVKELGNQKINSFIWQQVYKDTNRYLKISEKKH